MIDLPSLSLRRPVSMIMLYVSLLVVGGIAMLRLPLEMFPAIDVPFVLVQAPYPGASPIEVERTITRPIEEALATLSGVKKMNSQSDGQGSTVFMEFGWDNDVAIKASETRERVDAIRDLLPEDLQRYFVLKFSTSDEAILKVRLSSEEDLSGTYGMLERKFKRPLERLPGVARVEISGVAPKELEIELIADRIAAHDISLNELATRLGAANFSVSGGRIDDAGQRFRVQPLGELHTIEEMRDIIVNDTGLRLRDIANVQLKPGRLDYRRRLNQRPAVAIDLFKERNANLVEVGRSAMAEIERIGRDPELSGIEMLTISDQAEGVIESLMELAQAGVLGSLLSLIVLYFFLRHWPSTLMVSMAVPLCFVITLGVMYFLGVSLNILTMMGLLLGVGMVVDNAVVAVESIYQQREKMPGDPAAASVIGVRNVAIALSAGTLCHCIVFLPNIFGEANEVSIFLAQVAIAITVSLLASWLVAITLVPMLAARMSTPHFVHQDSAVSRLMKRYERFLRWTLAHRGKTMLGVALLLTISFVPLKLTKFEMFPSSSGRELNLTYRLSGNYTLREMEPSIIRVENYLLEHKKEFEIDTVYTWYTEQGDASTRISLVGSDKARKSPEEITELIRKELPKIPIGSLQFGWNDGGPGGGGVKLTITGDSMDQLRKIASTVMPLLERAPALRDVRLADTSATRELSVRVDRERAAQYGFSAQEVARYIAIALRGTPLREFRGEGQQDEVPVWLRFQGSDSQRVDSLAEFKLRRADGQLIPLSTLVDVRFDRAAPTITRENRRTGLDIQMNVAEGSTQDDARKELERATKGLALPTGYAFDLGGGFDQADEAGKQMLFNMLIALALIYIVMAAIFESLLLPITILTSVVFSIFGVFWLFWLTGTTFSIMAAIGILILMGVVVNNGIVMIEHINQLRHAGMSRTDALAIGSRDRLRPVLMTMGTAILGMVPIALSETQMGGQGPPYYPMARAIAGGLAFSTVITLLALPTFYAILDDRSMAMRRLVRRMRGQPQTDIESVVPQGAQV